MIVSKLPWIVLAGVAGLLVVGFATYFAVNAGDSSGSLEGTGTPPATASTGLPTTPPASTPTTVDTPPASTEPPPTEPPPTEVASTPDTRVPIMDRPTLDQIQLGADGEYFVEDRGDGCTWVEGLRQTYEGIGLEVSLFTDCPADFFFEFRPESGEIILTQE
jgi:hypothetical protein